MDIYNDTSRQRAIVTPWGEDLIGAIDLPLGYVVPLNLYFMSPDLLHPRAPYDIIRYAAASITAQLKRDGVAADAATSAFSEIVPNWLAGPTSSAAVTITIASPGVITWTGHGFAVGQAVVFSSTGALPTGLVANQIYYVSQITTNTFQVSATFGGPSVNTSGSQSGTHTGYAVTSVTRVTSGTSTKGEYDRIQLVAPPGSGSYFLNLRGGIMQLKGAVSATARIYPTVSSPQEVEAAFASSIGAPFSAEFVSPTCVDIHGSACPGTAPFIQEVNVSDLQFLFGWSGTLDLTAVPSNLAGVLTYLILLLTPSGGGQQRTLKLPVNLVG